MGVGRWTMDSTFYAMPSVKNWSRKLIMRNIKGFLTTSEQLPNRLFAGPTVKYEWIDLSLDFCSDAIYWNRKLDHCKKFFLFIVFRFGLKYKNATMYVHTAHDRLENKKNPISEFIFNIDRNHRRVWNNDIIFA